VFDSIHHLGEAAGLLDPQRLVAQLVFRTRLEKPGEDDLAGVRRDVDETAATCR
jgi:hypothetical protein